jgi:micrococcal nuclease
VCRFALGGLISLLLASDAIAQQESIRGRVVAVVDGDTIKVLIAEHTYFRVRLAFIDAPEIGQDFGSYAKRGMKALVFGREVELRPYTTDRCDCLVCTVFIGGIDVGFEMLRKGLAWAYEDYLPEAPAEMQKSYRDAQTVAQVSHLGLWQENNPEPPWEFRKEHGPGFPVPPM